MVTLEELKKSIREERTKVKKAQIGEALEIKRSRLKKELFDLKHRKALAVRGKSFRLLKKAGKGLFKAGKLATPVIKKQIKLIREQQLRDEAIEKRLSERIKVKTKKPKKKFKKVRLKTKKKSRSIRLEF